MPLEQAHLIQARQLADGQIIMEDTAGEVGDCLARIRAYDPRVSLIRNNAEDQWEVWRQCEDGVPRRVGFRAGVKVPHGDVLVAELARFDTWRGYDPVRDLEQSELAIARERARLFDDEIEDVADKFHWALSKDLSAHAPASRPMSMWSKAGAAIKAKLSR